MFDDGEVEQQNVEQPQPIKEEILPTGNIIELPSNGLFGYPRAVEYRDMMVSDEETLASATAENYAYVLNGVLKSVVNDFKYFEDMCIHDRDFLLIFIWANNYQSTKRLTVTCKNPECKHEDNVVVDLLDLERTPPREKFTGAIEIVLKKTNKPIKVRLNTVRDEVVVENYIAVTEADISKYSYFMNVASIDLGIELEFEKKLDWVKNNVTATEMGYIRKFHSACAFGVKTRLEHKCSKCGGKTPFELPFQITDILNPDVSFDIEKFL